MESSGLYKMRDKVQVHETRIMREIRIIAEVEKIWIQYDLDENGFLDFDELSEYLMIVAIPHLKLTSDQLKALFDKIDDNGDNCISKEEMGQFLHLLIHEQKDL